ncbi:hypothetical protein [Paenarthrobacter sp. YJN-5]|uniref:hypothetical protein n=1 Tax=Paenarthrobacter sp. YJN-5 TaxID=2735316 RepID=UPI001877D712|nr:hypothetical protein [Paenarthrobacter sp. YJN-5]QOT16498.1 hypothetical protein HMI59_07695 [Paenarthrobacter sp. YJN-5]
MTVEDERPRDKTPILTAKLDQLLHEHPDFYAQIFPAKEGPAMGSIGQTASSAESRRSAADEPRMV